MERERVDRVMDSLRRNHFEVYYVDSPLDAGSLFLREILPVINPRTVSWGDSETMVATGVLEAMAKRPELVLVRTFGEGMSRDQKLYWRRQALLSDLFLTGTNAVTERGQLVNLDMIGNRIGGITFGPEHVVLFIGVNKIVSDVEGAFQRIRTIAAPQNALRHSDFRTPCRVTGVCGDCRSPQRICNSWSIIEKSYPPGRIRVILIDQALGL